MASVVDFNFTTPDNETGLIAFTEKNVAVLAADIAGIGLISHGRPPFKSASVSGGFLGHSSLRWACQKTECCVFSELQHQKIDGESQKRLEESLGDP